jgi:hypothetical protein
MAGLSYPAINQMLSIQSLLFYAMYVVVSSPEAHGRITRMIGDQGIVNHVLHAMVFLWLFLFISFNFLPSADTGATILGNKPLKARFEP